MIAKNARFTGHEAPTNEGAQVTILQKPEALSPDEEHVLKSCELLIAKHLADFFQVGFALLTIQEERLYRADFASFEQYCRSKWGIGRSHAYRMLDAAKVHQILSPMGDTPLPQNERQVRPLAGLPKKMAEKAWKRAIEIAPNGQPTAETVVKAVREVCQNKPHKAQHPEIPLWQRLVLPLLKEAMAEAKSGNQDAVCDLLNKALLRVEVGHNTPAKEDYLPGCES